MENKRIIFKNSEGGMSVLVPNADCGLTLQEIANKDVPNNIDYDIVDVGIIPNDRTFRNAWGIKNAAVITDIVKARDIAHGIRRDKRNGEFKPYDEAIIRQIPGTDTAAAETARASIRTKYEDMQTALDAATSADELKDILGLS